jgi:hypothetical protein
MSRLKKDDLDSLFDNVAASLRVAPPIDPGLQRFLENIYGAPANLPLTGAIAPVPTIETTIVEAQKYLDLQHKKGFIKNPDLSSITGPYFRRRILTQQYLERKAEENQKRNAIDNLFELEPFQVFWFKSQCVRRTIVELSALPFFNSGDAGAVVSHFQDRVASIVRVMMHKGVLDERKQTETQLRKAMLDFVTNVRALRSGLIGAIVSDGKVEFAKMTPEQRKEFEGKRPRSTTTTRSTDVTAVTRQQSERDRRVIEKCADVDGFPEVYKTAGRRALFEHGMGGGAKTQPLSPALLQELGGRMHGLITMAEEEEARARAVRARSAAMTAANARRRADPVVLLSNHVVHGEKAPTTPATPPAPADPPLNVYRMFWHCEDPLPRTGESHDVLVDLHELSDRIDCPDHSGDLENITFPFALESKPRAEVEHLAADPLKDAVWSTADLAHSGSESGETSARQDPLPRVGVRTEGYAASHTETIRFLLQQYQDRSGGSAATREAETIHRRLEKIWEELGFSVEQRLTVLLKYSESLEESSKLSAALKFWEQALSVSEAYQNAYVDYRDMLKRADVASSKAIDLCAGQLQQAELSLLETAGTLRGSFGDDLIFRKRKVETLIEARRAKLAMMRGRLPSK